MKGENNPNWGKKISKEIIEKRKATLLKKSQEGYKRNINYDKREYKITTMLKGNNTSAKKVIDTLTGEIWECIVDASEANNIHIRRLSRYLNNPDKNKTNLLFL